MNRIILISDLLWRDHPNGGAEQVDKLVVEALNCDHIRCSVANVDSSCFYIVSNFCSLSAENKKKLIESKNYLILEHDYKFCPSRNPWDYNTEGIVPEAARINVEFYNNARTILLQSMDHHAGFSSNGFTNLSVIPCGLWSTDDLGTLRYLRPNVRSTHSLAIYNSPNPGKNAARCVQIAKENNWDYTLIDPDNNRETFLRHLSRHPGLLYYPKVRESMCRIVIEARCLDMNVFMFRLCGAIADPAIAAMHGAELVDYLQDQSEENLDTIKKLI